MKRIEPQPNFEVVKRLFYQTFVGCERATLCVSMQNLCGKLLPSFYTRYDEFKADFNKWLDRLDIRSVPEIIDAVKEQGGVTVPGWMAKKEFVIDYNDKGALDLLRIENIHP